MASENKTKYLTVKLPKQNNGRREWIFKHIFQNFHNILSLTVVFNEGILKAVVQRCSVKKVFLEISQNSQENTCTRVSFLIRLQRPATLFKKRRWHRCFPVNFVKFLGTPFYTEHLWWLLLAFCHPPTSNPQVKIGGFIFVASFYFHILKSLL